MKKVIAFYVIGYFGEPSGSSSGSDGHDLFLTADNEPFELSDGSILTVKNDNHVQE